MDRVCLPVLKDYRLNESETAQKYGEDQVLLWRRSFDVKPPALRIEDERAPHNQKAYQRMDQDLLPLHESLKETIERVVPYFEDTIKVKMIEGKNIMIVAHGNSIRSLLKYFDDLSNDEIMAVNIPTAVPLIYEFDENFKVVKSYYLGDQAEIEKEMEAVAKQGSAK